MTSAPAEKPPLVLPIIGVVSEARQRTIAICLALMVVTGAVYWFSGPQDTPYAHQVSQANNILHGHLDLLPQYSKNLNTLERVLYDGHGFCFAPGDPEASKVSNARISPTCKTYMQHSLGPAFIEIPGVLIWGSDLNQTAVSIVFGAMTAPVVFLISRAFTKKLLNQLLLTILMMFGTILWWVASNGGVWFFAHTTATFFLFSAIYFAINRPNPLLAGAMLGAAFMCRPTVIMDGLFFVVVFIPYWLHHPTEERPGWHISIEPLANFVAGLAPFLALEMYLNWARFDNPLETGYNYGEQVHQDYLQYIYNHGTFSLHYINRHPPVIFEQMPIFDKPGTVCSTNPPLDCAPIRPSWNGMAIWVTTPIFLTTFFTGINLKIFSRIGAALIAIACAVIFSRAFVQIWHTDWQHQHIPLGLQLWPFWLMIAAAIVFSIRNRDRMIFACWAAIIPTGLLIFLFAATGWAQFGYRYGLDFTPFLWLLVARFIGDDLKWWHIALIVAGIVVNFCGVLWIYHFDVSQTTGWAWATF